MVTATAIPIALPCTPRFLAPPHPNLLLHVSSSSDRRLRFLASHPSSRMEARPHAHGEEEKNGRPTGSFVEEFSMLPQDTPWEGVDVWTTMALYFFSLHIPLSFGGLSIVSQVLHQPELDPLTEAVSALALQATEFIGALAFLNSITKQKNVLISIFQYHGASKGRNWIKASSVGLGALFLLVLFTSFLADQLVGPKDVNDLAVHKILDSGPAARTVMFFVDCFTTPLLEETIFRGFLLRYLASTLEWKQAVLISALIFSLAHFSLENAPQLFAVGTILGCVYCWSGSLASSMVVHSVYNAAILIITWLA